MAGYPPVRDYGYHDKNVWFTEWFFLGVRCMRVAVASHDGRDVASAPEQARYILVFPVTDDVVGEPEVRVLGAAPELSTSPERKLAASDIATRMVSFPPLAAPTNGEAEDLPEEFLHALLDCEVLIVRTMRAKQRETCLRLGMLPLEVSAAGDAAHLVRFVVSGTPPSAGSSCSGCTGLPRRPAVASTLAGSLVRGR